MKLLMVNSASYVNEDVMHFLSEMFGAAGLKELYYDFKGKDVYDNGEFKELFEKELNTESFDCVMSTDFYPVIAELCHRREIKYISWPYDAPMNVLPCPQMGYETNFIFHFDKIEIEKYRKLGYDRFWHMALGVNTRKYDVFHPEDRFAGDIAFLGKLYRSKLPIIKQGLSGELVVYLDKLVKVQKENRDRWIVDELVSQPIIDEMNRQYEAAGTGLSLVKEQITYTIAEYVTYLDRVELLEMLGRRFDVHLYTYDIGDTEKELLKNVKIHGPVYYNTEMPVLFKTARINLNSSLRSAQSAVPLRALDVFGCGGFLLSNAQPELKEFFEDRKEVVLFKDTSEAIELAGYYLDHDDERKEIAAAGYEKVKRDFKYEDKLAKMFEIAGF